MALIKCPECGREVSDRAASCPNCGYPISNSVSKTTSSSSAANYAQVRVVCKTATIKVDGQKTSHGGIVKIYTNGSKKILCSAWGGTVGALGSSCDGTVVAGHKYDLDMHHTLVGRMLYLKEVDSFV